MWCLFILEIVNILLCAVIISFRIIVLQADFKHQLEGILQSHKKFHRERARCWSINRMPPSAGWLTLFRSHIGRPESSFVVCKSMILKTVFFTIFGHAVTITFDLWVLPLCVFKFMIFKIVFYTIFGHVVTITFDPWVLPLFSHVVTLTFGPHIFIDPSHRPRRCIQL